MPRLLNFVKKNPSTQAYQMHYSFKLISGANLYEKIQKYKKVRKVPLGMIPSLEFQIGNPFLINIKFLQKNRKVRLNPGRHETKYCCC